MIAPAGGVVGPFNMLVPQMGVAVGRPLPPPPVPLLLPVVPVLPLLAELVVVPPAVPVLAALPPLFAPTVCPAPLPPAPFVDEPELDEQCTRRKPAVKRRGVAKQSWARFMLNLRSSSQTQVKRQTAKRESEKSRDDVA
jgi:hypothetical protein